MFLGSNLTSCKKEIARLADYSRVRTGHWKVVEFKNFIFQARKVMEIRCRSLKIMEILFFVCYVGHCRWLSKVNVRESGVIKQRERHTFWWTPEFVSVELFKVKKYPETWNVLNIFERDSKTQGHGKREKVMEKVMQGHGIWRAQKSTSPVTQ